MAVVTITSDWLREDYYLGTLKGRLLSLSENLNIVEISRSITPHDVQNEAFILKNTYSSFPVGTIHLMCVFSEPEECEPMVIVYNDNHYFVGLNDGRFSYLFEQTPAIAFGVKGKIRRSGFDALDFLVKGVDIILNNSFEKDTFAVTLTESPQRRAVFGENTIIGRVVHIDSFGNAITNIDKYNFDRVAMGRGFRIFVQGPFIKSDNLSDSYHSNENSNTLFFFNSAGLLEIAMETANFAQIENIDTTSEIRIVFSDEKGR